MDKNYNVDDILLEIKSKKSREKQSRSGQEPRPAPRPPVRQGQEEPGESGSFHFALEDLSGPPPEPDAREFPRRGERSRATAPVEPVLPREPADRQAEAPFAAEPEHPPAPRAEEPARPASRRREPDPDGDEFRFVLADEHGEDDDKANPMNFEGHVQSIADRAKVRNRSGRPPHLRHPLTPPPAVNTPGTDATQVLDFASFGEAAAPPSDTAEHTRVLPKLGHSRELDLGELRDMDFGAAGYEDDDYEDDEFEDDDIVAGSKVDFSEYNSISDRRDVAIDIARVKLWLVIRAAATLLLTALLFFAVFAGRAALGYGKFEMFLPGMMDPAQNMRGFMTGLTVLTVAVALVNSSAVGGGLISLFRMRANSDSLAALALLGAVGQCVFGMVRHELVKPEDMTIYCCVAALSMLFNAVGKMTMISRIQANFKIISSDRPKKAVLLADSAEFSRELTDEPSRRPSVAIAARTGFFTDFLALSYSDRYDVGINRAVAPACLLGAVVVCVLTYMLTGGDTMTAVSALTAILCVAATFSATFIENVPLGKLTRKLAPQGGMVSGNKAVEDFCDTRAVVLTDRDLFPADCVKLLGIKTHSQGRVDEAILDAASVVCATGGALSEVFLGMIGGNRKLLKKVDNLVFENGMGVSAWVDGRRVLIGNRTLMQNHGIALPQPGYEEKYAAEGGESIYLSNSGEVCAQFVIGYQFDEELALELDALAAKGLNLAVYTMDANVTPEKVWSVYGYPQEQIRILPAELHGEYDRMTAPREAEMAEIAYTGKASAMVGAILACIQARASILTATVVQLVQITVGYGLIALMAFMGVITTLSIVELCVYQFFWFLAILLIQKLRSA